MQYTKIIVQNEYFMHNSLFTVIQHVHW